MHRCAPMLLALMLPAPAWAQAASVTHLTYDVYGKGVNVVTIDSTASLEPSRYRVDLSYRTVGLFSALFHTDIHSFAQGVWTGSRPLPLRFASWGHARGMDRSTVIDYPEGVPVVRQLVPAHEEDRDPVPEGMERDTVDTLSAMALLVHEVARTGRCDGHTVTYDGHRVFDITARTGGEEVLEPTSRSSFSGRALRCNIEGRQTAGFLHDESEEQLHRVHYDTAWLAPLLPNTPPLPVRVDFDARFIGQATAYLTSATPAQPAK